MKTRENYMNNDCTHHEYYSQFIIPSIESFIKNRYKKSFLKKCYEEDVNLNNLGNNWMAAFDSFTLSHKHEFSRINFEINGSNSFSLSMGCCAIKAYIRNYINE